MEPSATLAEVTEALRRAGCVAAEEEAAELFEGAQDQGTLDALVARRVGGEPLAWITGSTRFCGIDVFVDKGVYVPRWQSEPLALRAAELLGDAGCAVDVCTGSGAIAAVLRARRPRASVVATEIDPVAAACARRNGVTVYLGDLDDPLPRELEGAVDVLTGVLPYVPTEAMHLLARDARDFEPRRALDGGPGGTTQLARLVPRSRRWLRSGGWLLLELGTDQVDSTAGILEKSQFDQIGLLVDGDGDARGLCARV